VIGSGPNGLSAAITLAKAGLDVLVLERAGRPGGAVATEELTLPGFRHDTFSAVHPAAALSPVFARMPLARHGLRWVHPGACYAHPLPDGSAVTLYRDLDRTAASLDALRPGDGDRWRAFARRYLRLRHAPGLARVVAMPAEALARELFRAAANRAWLYGSAMHGDVPPQASGSAIAAVVLNLAGHAAGWPSPAGGAGRLADALVAYLAELGGRVRTDAEVTRVTVGARGVTGVELAGGERLEAPLVVADVMPHALLALAGAALPRRYAAALARYRYGPGTLKLDWALDGPIPWLAAEAREAGTVHVGGTEQEVLDAARQFLLLGQQSLADPSRAPPGRHTAWAYTHTRGASAESVEAEVERFAPGFRDRILARHVLTPDDFERRNPNLVGGDVGGGSYALDQLLFRPLPKAIPYRTPIRGLYLASAATPPGGSVHGIAGYLAARVALLRPSLHRRRPRLPWGAGMGSRNE
jgi:phytoene dehydrogenase-like protein